MGRGCGCCTNKASESCCPENVFEDSNSGLLLSVFYLHTKEDEVINLTITSDKIQDDVLLSFNAKKNGTYTINIIFTNFTTTSILQNCGQSEPYGLDGSYDCIVSNRRIYYEYLDINNYFNKDNNQHTLITKLNGDEFVGALTCVKKYTGDKDKLFNGKQPPNCFGILIDDLQLSKKIYYKISEYDYDGKYWYTNRKYGCLCPCNNVKAIPFAITTTVNSNRTPCIFDECGCYDGDTYASTCDRIYFMTLTSKSKETDEEYLSTSMTIINNNNVSITVQNGEEPEFTEELGFIFTDDINPGFGYMKHLKPASENDEIEITADLSVIHSPCSGLMGCENCPDDTRCPCHCFTDSYSLGITNWTYKYDSNLCTFNYTPGTNINVFPYPVPFATGELNVHRTYRTRNKSKSPSRFELTISNIEFDYDTYFGFNFASNQCKEEFTNFVKSFEGTYSFNLTESCGIYEWDGSNSVFGEISRSCGCIGFQGLSLNYKKAASGRIKAVTYNGAAICGSELIDGISSAEADITIYSAKGGNTESTACFYTTSNGLVIPVYWGQIGGGISFSFTGHWFVTCYQEYINDINSLATTCAGNGQVNASADLDAIEYRNIDFTPFLADGGFVYTVKGKFYES